MSLEEISVIYEALVETKLKKGYYKATHPICVTDKFYKGRQLNWDPVTKHDTRYFYEVTAKLNRKMARKRIQGGITIEDDFIQGLDKQADKS